jgi:hypothetical protein
MGITTVVTVGRDACTYRHMQADRDRTWEQSPAPGFATIPDGRMR